MPETLVKIFEDADWGTLEFGSNDDLPSLKGETSDMIVDMVSFVSRALLKDQFYGQANIVVQDGKNKGLTFSVSLTQPQIGAENVNFNITNAADHS